MKMMKTNPEAFSVSVGANLPIAALVRFKTGIALRNHIEAIQEAIKR